MNDRCCICADYISESYLKCSLCNDTKYCISCYSKLKCNCSQCSCWNNLFNNGTQQYIPRVVYNCENNIHSCAVCRKIFTFHRQHKIITEAIKLNRGATYKNINLLNKIRSPLINTVKELIKDYNVIENYKSNYFQKESYNLYNKISDINREILGDVFFDIDNNYIEYLDKPLTSWLGPSKFRTNSKKITILIHSWPKGGESETKYKKLTFKLDNKLKVTLRDIINFTDSWKFANNNYLWAETSLDHRFFEGIRYVEKNTVEISTGS